jgi:ABC-2 type transport system ATP-binding protein
MNKRNATIILNSHLLSEVEMICNRVAIMNKGKVVAQDELRQFRNFDFETYSVEFDATECLPEYLNVKIKKAGTIKAEIPSPRLLEFIRFTDEQGLKVYECFLKKTTLEDTFLTILEGEDK